MGNYKERLKNITTFILDYDGVLSDGNILVLESGEQVRTGWVKDGYALHHALKRGYRVAIISGGTSPAIAKRCQSIGITDIFTGVTNKILVFDEYLKREKITADEVLYIGDDIPDYKVMQQVGVAVCPADAAEEIKSIATYISAFGGGFGCVRDVVEQVLKVRNDWMTDDAFDW
ncbi:MAG: HAD hydrolase family protein [Bacteroidota bacterium]